MLTFAQVQFANYDLKPILQTATRGRWRSFDFISFELCPLLCMSTVWQGDAAHLHSDLRAPPSSGGKCVNALQPDTLCISFCQQVWMSRAPSTVKRFVNANTFLSFICQCKAMIAAILRGTNQTAFMNQHTGGYVRFKTPVWVEIDFKKEPGSCKGRRCWSPPAPDPSKGRRSSWYPRPSC